MRSKITTILIIISSLTILAISPVSAQLPKLLPILGIDGNGTANFIAKFLGPNTIGDSAIFESGGKVGIGTNTPSEELTVAGDIEAEGLNSKIKFVVDIFDQLPDPVINHGMLAHVHTEEKVYFAHSVFGWIPLANEDHTHNKLTGPFGSPDPAVIVDSEGDVGIGTPTPGANRLDVRNPNPFGFGVSISAGSGSNYALAINDFLGNSIARFLGNGNVGIGTMNPGAKLTVNGPLIRRIVRTQHYAQDGTDDGPLNNRSVTFTKTQSDTGIRVLWSDNFRVLGNSKACRWEIKFNGNSCTNPGGLYVSKYQADGGVGANYHEPTTMAATCMNLPAGTYTIQGYVGPHPSFLGSDCYTGWESLFSLEAEEVY